MLEHLPAAVGHALQGLRPGLDAITANRHFADRPDTIIVSSTAFGPGQPIPADYTADGHGMSPPLAWRNVPAGTAEIVLMIEDADSPTPKPLVHAIVSGLVGVDAALAEGELPSPGRPGGSHPVAKNSFLKAEYLPPDPPTGHGPHRYVVQVFALDTSLRREPEPGRGAMIEAMRGHVLARGTLIGTYERR